MDYPLAFLTGFFSSLHCAGMCGPLVLAYASADGGKSGGVGYRLLSHASYNAGRVLSYAFFGGMLAAVGTGISGIQGVGFWFSLIVGVATVAFGVDALRRKSAAFGTANGPAGGALTALLARGMGVYRATFGALVAHPSLESRFTIGLLTPLLPCGLLYGMLIRSAGAESVWDGVGMMAAFGLGIVPALAATGFLASYAGSKVRSWGERIASLMLILMGLSLIWRGVMAGGSHH